MRNLTPKLSALITIGLIIMSCMLVYFHIQGPDNEQKFTFGQTAFAEFIPEKLESIVFQHGDQTIELKRRANYSWEVKAKPTDFDADEAKIRNFLVKLISIRVGDSIPGGENRPHVFGFSAASDQEGVRQASKGGSYVALRGLNNTPLIEMFLGKERKFGSGVYARFSGKPEVYLIPENFSDIYDWEFWLNKNILDIENSEIAAIDFLMLKGAPRLERLSAADPWTEIKKTNKKGALFSPMFKQETLPKLINSLQELQFIHVAPKKVDANSLTHASGKLEKEMVSKIGLELFSGKYITVTLYKHQNKESNAVSPYYASFQMNLVHMESLEKMATITFVSDREDFNYKSEPWFFVLDEASASRFLVN